MITEVEICESIRQPNDSLQELSGTHRLSRLKITGQIESLSRFADKAPAR